MHRLFVFLITSTLVNQHQRRPLQQLVSASLSCFQANIATHCVAALYRNLLLLCQGNTVCLSGFVVYVVYVCTVSITHHFSRTPHRHHRATGHVLSISVISIWHRCPNLLLSNQHTRTYSSMVHRDHQLRSFWPIVCIVKFFCTSSLSPVCCLLGQVTQKSSCWNGVACLLCSARFNVITIDCDDLGLLKTVAQWKNKQCPAN